LSDENLEGYIAEFTGLVELSNRRLEALAGRKKRNPGWKFYDKYGEDFITLDTVIEVIEAEAGFYGQQLEALSKDVDRRRGLNQTIKMF